MFVFFIRIFNNLKSWIDYCLAPQCLRKKNNEFESIQSFHSLKRLEMKPLSEDLLDLFRPAPLPNVEMSGRLQFSDPDVEAAYRHQKFC
ncbi:MAG: hypothetical protein R2875_05755 [Desulfobacterales bacterium]